MHADIKPQNILLHSSSDDCVLDGAARVVLTVRVPRRPRALLRAQYGDKVLEGYRVDFVHWLIHSIMHTRLPPAAQSRPR